jgi:alpha-tubulin suppressor-like RCC1 family protein
MRAVGFSSARSLSAMKRPITQRAWVARVWMALIVAAGLGCILPAAASAEPLIPGCAGECEIMATQTPSEVSGLEYEGTGEEEGFTPQELRSAYNLPEHGGSGNTIAIVDGAGDPNAEADLKFYRERYGLPKCTEEHECFKQLDEHGVPNKPVTDQEGWSVEIALDLDMVSAACPECHIVLLEGKGRTGRAEADEEAAKLGVTAVTNSWNFGFEKNNPANSNVNCTFECVTSEEETTYDSYFNHPGTPILFSGGDYGYAVRYPAVSQYTVSVGGTQLTKVIKTKENTRGWGEAVWSNEAYGVDRKGRGTGSGCSLYEPKPAWQSQNKVDNPCTKRIENDVSADADPHSPVSIYDSYEYCLENKSGCAAGWLDAGGTSASSPFVAGVEGLSSSNVRSLGAEAMWLAGLNKSLFDVSIGSNGTCTPPAEDVYWCTAEVGYDGPTGNGTPDGPFEVPRPTVAKMAPNEGPEAGGTSVTITGTNFESATTVKFGTIEATSFKVVSSTSIKATAPAQAAGTVDVTVKTSKGGTSPTGSADHFTYLPRPTVTNVQANAGGAGGGTKVMISGSGFTGVSGVKFGKKNATGFTVISETWISAVSPSGSGTVDVTVSTGGGTSTTGSADQFTYRSGGTSYGWGDNSAGELGDGTTTGPETCGGEACSRGPVAASGSLGEVTAVSAGEDHSLALQGAGTIVAWGANSAGELGNGTTTASSMPVKVSSLTTVGAVAAGREFSVAQLKGGTVRAWGYNAYGQLGDGSTTSRSAPVKVHGITEAVAVAAGETHSLALLKNGTVEAWGQNAAGELGNGTTTNSNEPVKVSGITEAVAISAGGEFSLAVLKNGTVEAWGYNGAGQLGNGSTTSSSTPVAVSGLSEVVAVSAGGAHSLALLKTGAVKSWGANQSGQLGNGSCCSMSDVPVKVSSLSEATAVAAGFHSLALTRGGTVMDWGRNSDGQLGDGTSTGPETCEPFEEGPRACSKTPVTASGLTEGGGGGISEGIGIDGGINYALAIGK